MSSPFTLEEAKFVSDDLTQKTGGMSEMELRYRVVPHDGDWAVEVSGQDKAKKLDGFAKLCNFFQATMYCYAVATTIIEMREDALKEKENPDANATS
tara:strand:+ start:1035 stop:1325 length:291 start_codon:yes stop_codon:yes gene_type:complete